MPDYKEMYFELASKVADAVELLTLAQQAGEDRYIEEDSGVIELLPACREESER